MDIPERTTCEIGKYTYGVPLVKSWEKERNLKVGAFCSIGGNVTLYLNGAHDMMNVSTFPFEMFCDDWKDYLETEQEDTKGNIEIGNDVWIGDGVSVLYGSTISDGCVIGAFSVVRGHIPPYSIVLGNPAKIIGKRFSDKQISSLLMIRWWDWPDEKIKENIGLIMSHDVDRFIDKHIGSCID